MRYTFEILRWKALINKIPWLALYGNFINFHLLYFGNKSK